MNILVVDDDLVCRDTLSVMLRRNSHEVFTAANGREALEKLARHDFQVVITDWMMPELNGPTLCSAIREGDFGHYIFIILLTSRDSPEDVIRGLSAGADEFMTKPFHVGEVRARIRTAERILALESNTSSSEEAPPPLQPPRRFSYRVRQWAAPCVTGCDPDVTDFVSVECCELYEGGVSFKSAVPFESDEVVITLGKKDAMIFVMSGVIDRRTELDEHGSTVYMLACEFIRRRQIDARRLAKGLKEITEQSALRLQLA